MNIRNEVLDIAHDRHTIDIDGYRYLARIGIEFYRLGYSTTGSVVRIDAVGRTFIYD